MVRTLVVYESKYGATALAAKNIAKFMGPSRYCRVNEFKDEYRDFDFFILCTPIYADAIDNVLMEFVKSNRDWLKDKRTALLCSCLDGKSTQRYFKPINDLLKEGVIWQGSVGGIIDLDKLDENDYNSMKTFCGKIGLPFKSYDTFNKERFVDISLEIKQLKDKTKDGINPQELKGYINEFIKSKNTCTLCTGYKDRIRATPMEYIFSDGFIYFLSEGGEKFGNIFLNPNVSIAIYEDYESMNNLSGMQITGEASVIDTGNSEYDRVIAYKGLTYDKVTSLGIHLNMVKVSIRKVEFLWSGFSELGHDTKQIYISQQ